MRRFQYHKEENIINEENTIGGFSKDEIDEGQEKYMEHSLMYREEDEGLMNNYECSIKHFQD